MNLPRFSAEMFLAKTLQKQPVFIAVQNNMLFSLGVAETISGVCHLLKFLLNALFLRFLFITCPDRGKRRKGDGEPEGRPSLEIGGKGEKFFPDQIPDAPAIGRNNLRQRNGRIFLHLLIHPLRLRQPFLFAFVEKNDMRTVCRVKVQGLQDDVRADINPSNEGRKRGILLTLRTRSLEIIKH